MRWTGNLTLARSSRQSLAHRISCAGCRAYQRVAPLLFLALDIYPYRQTIPDRRTVRRVGAGGSVARGRVEPRGGDAGPTGGRAGANRRPPGARRAGGVPPGARRAGEVVPAAGKNGGSPRLLQTSAR